jgi:hypothetical protein
MEIVKHDAAHVYTVGSGRLRRNCKGVYMQEIPESVQATVNSIHSELRAKSAPRRAKAWTADQRAQASLKSKERLAAKKSPTSAPKTVAMQDTLAATL